MTFKICSAKIKKLAIKHVTEVINAIQRSLNMTSYKISNSLVLARLQHFRDENTCEEISDFAWKSTKRKEI